MRFIITETERPTILYKYRNWNSSFHRRFLTHLETYMASPIDFNDPFDGHIPVRYDLLTYDDCYNKNYQSFSRSLKNSGVSEMEIRRYIKELTDSKKFFHPETMKREDVSIWNKKIGLISFSEIPDNILMWSHYADNHKGFCLGIWTDLLKESELFDYLEPVKYFEEYPIIGGFEVTSQRFYKRFFSKSKLWEYEKEWRLTKNHIEKRTFKLPPGSLAQIILGCRIDIKIEKEIIKIRDQKYHDVPIFKAKVSDSKFGLELENI